MAGASDSTLEASWTPPDNTGPPITGYDVAYRPDPPRDGDRDDNGHRWPGVEPGLRGSRAGRQCGRRQRLVGGGFRTHAHRAGGRGRPPSRASKPAISGEVSTDSVAVKVGRSPAASACEPHREMIEEGLSRGRNGVAIWQDLVDDHGFELSLFTCVWIIAASSSPSVWRCNVCGTRVTPLSGAEQWRQAQKE